MRHHTITPLILVYDPRLTVGGARKLAIKNIGKKHLVYFFECHDAPFTVVGDSKVIKWEDGILEEYDLGKTARANGKHRMIMFEHALQAAIAEFDKPVAYRLDWNHQSDSFAPSMVNVGKNTVSTINGFVKGPVGTCDDGGGSTKKRAKKSIGRDDKEKVTQHSFLTVRRSGRSGRQGSSYIVDHEEARVLAEALELSKTDTEEHDKKISMTKSATVNRCNLNAVINSFDIPSANEIERLEDGKLFCKILCKQASYNSETYPVIESEKICNVGFITLPSQKTSTFADARRAISSDLDEDSLPHSNWKFYIPKLGIMSLKQEDKIGSMLDLLRKTTNDERIGHGTCSSPLKIVILCTK